MANGLKLILVSSFLDITKAPTSVSNRVEAPLSSSSFAESQVSSLQTSESILCSMSMKHLELTLVTYAELFV